MNIEKLVAAAKEIDRLAVLQQERTLHMQQLAARARKADPHELRRIQDEMRSKAVTVTDFGDAINAIRRALKARPSATPSS